MDDKEKRIVYLENTIRAFKGYVVGWNHANYIDWPEGTLGADDKARNELWFAGLYDMMNSLGDWADEPIVYIDEEECAEEI